MVLLVCSRRGSACCRRLAVLLKFTGAGGIGSGAPGGLGNELIDGPLSPANTNGRVERRERLGGLLNFYHRQAA